jgi:single-strand DNA-binding protein
MARTVNKVILLGNVGKDPEVTQTRAGESIARFTLATSDRWRDKSGIWQSRTEWHNLIAYAHLAEFIEKCVRKGDRIYVEGRIETVSWPDESRPGEKHYQTRIKINEVVALMDQPAAEPQPAVLEITPPEW